MQNCVDVVMPILDLDKSTSPLFLQAPDLQYSFSCSDDLTVHFSHALSVALLNNKTARSFPDVVTFAYFCRRANINSILTELQNRTLRQGWGRLVHITPSNIPVNFAFSLMMGVLSGNTNYVRLPSRNYPQIDVIIDAIQSVLCQNNFEEMANRITFFRCERGSDALLEAVAECDGLVVWGGDETVSYFRSLHKEAHVVEIYFPNRVSSLIIDAAAIIESDNQILTRLFSDFFNDTFLIDQNACSSPNILYWIGEEKKIKKAKKVFWSGFENYLKSKVKINPLLLIEKKLELLKIIQNLSASVKIEAYGPQIWLFENKKLANQRLRYGNFLQVNISELSSVSPYIRNDEQTITYFGIQPTDLAEIIITGGYIVDRIVPVGQALAMGVHWDGKHILALLSHQMEVI